MKTSLLFGLTVVVFGIVRCASVWAEVPPISDEQLANQATLIVTGFITAISERDETTHPSKDSRATLVTADYTVTMTVETVEKGNLPHNNHTLQFTGYRNIHVPVHWMGGTNTLRLDLQAGDEIKVYLEGKEGHWALFHHMGIWLRG